MNKTLLSLIDLQKFDTMIYELNLLLKEIPRELDKLKQEQSSLTTTLNAFKDEFKKIEMEKKNNENELLSTQEKISKFDSQLYQIKNNDEYKKMLKQINLAKVECSMIEEAILLKMEEVDVVKEKIKKEEDALTIENEKIKKKEEKFDKENKRITEKINEYEEQKKTIKKNIEPETLKKYEQILVKRKNTALSAVKNDSCSECNMILQPHIVDQAKACKELITCDTCSRILYDPEVLEL